MVKSYYAGMDLDAPCGRCKGETRHRILSITDGTPEKLICTSCNSVHKFRAEKPAKATAAPRPARMATASSPKPASSPSRFQELMITEQAGTKAQPYSPAMKWEDGMWMDHPNFGLGKVQRKSGRKAEVLFREGLKTLLSA
ncbi:MAG: zinc ribbon domain-containing protein [Holophaga sp.]|nr:zinc ribbon domain-containing protein [Holophaga sp.]